MHVGTTRWRVAAAPAQLQAEWVAGMLLTLAPSPPGRRNNQPAPEDTVQGQGGGIDTVGMLVGLTPTTSPSLGHTEPMVAASWAPWDDSIDTPSPLPHQILDFARKVSVRYVQRH
uniref:Uncharacterized protein n=1 Tax=Oryza meridionalis TaxID=40149 RepID=A0A0E0FAG3_9ORYZ